MTLTEIFKQVIFNNSFLRPCFTISKKKIVFLNCICMFMYLDPNLKSLIYCLSAVVNLVSI